MSVRDLATLLIPWSCPLVFILTGVVIHLATKKRRSPR